MSTGPQWRLAHDLYLAASALEGNERQKFLDERCPDSTIRQQVEELLAGDTPVPLATGNHLGHYIILSKLGSGGMGSVYEAQDSRLNRNVAIKVLGGKHAGSAHQLAREAQAASSLNHPNIVTVYEIGRDGNVDFIAMERIVGDTLGKVIGKNGIELKRAIRIAIQIADALAAAHEAGIVHRDLKPGNVMITERELVKVLDFGLAKRIVSQSETPTETLTQPGKVFGTVAYMSPEQAQGVHLDGRSDIFSFGCVLYEMVTGQRAFHEEGDLMTLAAVVSKDPQPAAQLCPGLPDALARIIEICLRKKRTERWHHIADVKLMLEEAAKQLEAPIEEAAVSRAPAGWLSIALAGAAGIALTAGAFWLMGRRAPESVPVPVYSGAFRVTNDAGLTAFPALSRAGNLLAFASDRGNHGNLDIWIQQIGGREPLQVTHDTADCTDPDLSPEGTRVAYRSERSGGGIYVRPALGGEEVLVAPGGRNPKFSPDGKWIAYWEGHESGGYLPGSARAYIVEAGGGSPRPVGADMQAALYPVWSPKGDWLLVLGRQANDTSQASVDWWMVPADKGAPVRTNALARLHQQGLERPAWQTQLVPLAWFGDDRPKVLFAAGPLERTGDVGDLWEMELSPGAEARSPAAARLSGPGYYLQASIAPGPKTRLAFENLVWKVGVWQAKIDAETGKAASGLKDTDYQLLTESEPYAAGSALSRDGRALTFLTRHLGASVLRSRDLVARRDVTLISNGPRNSQISGDGNTVAYSDIEGSIFVMPALGGKIDKLCGPHCGNPMGLSSDGKLVTYEPWDSEDLMIWDALQRKQVVAAKRPENTVISGSRFSPDDQWIAFHAVATKEATSQIWVVRRDRNVPVDRKDWIAITDGQSDDRMPVWSPNGGLIYFISERDGFRCVWARKLDVSKKPVGDAFPVSHFHSARRSLKRIGPLALTGLAVAPGKILLSFGELTGNVWLEEWSR